MNNLNIILISLVAALTLSGYTLLNFPLQEDVKSANQFSYYVFEREIPASVCKQSKCKKDFMLNYDGTSANMHGLWPSGNDSDICAQPGNCNDIEYNQSLVDSSLLQWMNQEFVGLYSSSTSFRAHEYEKHGSCTLQANSMGTKELENYYFGQIQQLNDKYNLVKTLNEGGIKASDTQSYTYQEIMEVLQNGFEGQSDYDVRIRCLNVGDKIYLGAIDLYVDLEFNLGKNLCAESKKLNGQVSSFNDCSQKKPIYYPEFSWSDISS